MFFNVFIDDLLLDLKSTKGGISIDSFHLNSFAYADDVTLLNSTVPGLQQLINKCVAYATAWRFTFGIVKSKCMIRGPSKFQHNPQWLLGSSPMQTVDVLDILGTSFQASGKSDHHTDSRIQKCRRSIYGMRNVGMSYPGLASEVKAHLWKTIGVPSLVYGMDSIGISTKGLQAIESLQGSLMKQMLGLPKRSHHQKLLSALHISPVEPIINQRTLSLFHRIFNTNSPARSINALFLAKFIAHNELPAGSLIYRVHKLGHSLVKVALSDIKLNNFTTNSGDGIVDSLRVLLYHDNFCKPWSGEHLLAELLTKAF
jgi:hypothetical protein